MVAKGNCLSIPLRNNQVFTGCMQILVDNYLGAWNINNNSDRVRSGHFELYELSSVLHLVHFISCILYHNQEETKIPTFQYRYRIH